MLLRIVLDYFDVYAIVGDMSEKELPVRFRDERGRVLPGVSLNDRRLRTDQQAAIEAIRNEFTPKIVDMINECWREASDKVKVQLLAILIPQIAGKPATVHHRINTKFEDMLAALGSNEPVTIDADLIENENQATQ